MKTFVITKPEDGWDCVFGVYEAESEERVIQGYMDNYGDELEDGQTYEDYANKKGIIVHQSILTILL